MFGTSGTEPAPTWVSVPNPGPVPLEIARWTWTFHSDIEGTLNAGVTVERQRDHAKLAVARQTLPPGFGQDAISWAPSGWTP